MEEWRDINGFPGYQVSDEGRVRSFYKSKGYGGGCIHDVHANPKILSPTTVGTGGHLRVFLYRNKKKIALLLHRLVAETFIPNPNNYPIVRHLNDDPKCNHVNNLAWGTQRDNVHDCMRHNRNRHDGLIRYNNSRKTPIVAINVETGEEFICESQNEASRRFRISQGNIWRSIMNGTKTCGYYFRKAEEVIDDGDY